MLTTAPENQLRLRRGGKTVWPIDANILAARLRRPGGLLPPTRSQLLYAALVAEAFHALVSPTVEDANALAALQQAREAQPPIEG